jgi:phosphomethylpyrimidine synthase
MHYARKGLVTEEMAYIAARERVEPTMVRDEVARGRLVVPPT